MFAHKYNSILAIVLLIHFIVIWCHETEASIQNANSSSNKNTLKQFNPDHNLRYIREISRKQTRISTDHNEEDRISISILANINKTIPNGTREKRSVRNESRENISIVKKFLNGFTIDSNGKPKLTENKVAYLKSFRFNITNPETFIGNELHHTCSENDFELMKQGVNRNSLSLQITSDFEKSEEGTSIGHGIHSVSNSTFILHSIIRTLCREKNIELYSDSLKMDPSFYNATIDAIGSGRVNLQSAENLVNVLNKYGWYLPTKFILGGAKLLIRKKSLKNEADIESAITAFFTEYQNIQDASHLHESQTKPKTSEDIYYEFIGGISNEDDQMFCKSVDDANNWDIVKYVEFMPTLKLLYHEDPYVFGHCLKLLIQFNSYSTIRHLQKYINIRDYAMKLEIDAFQKD